MGAVKWVVIGTMVLFGSIGTVALLKPKTANNNIAVALPKAPVGAPQVATASPSKKIKREPPPPAQPAVQKQSPQAKLPQANKIDQLFSVRGETLPFIETVTYSSRAPWQKGKAAWIADYARHHATSTHFIARSLNGRADYEVPPVANGDRFNVLRTEGNWDFYLLVDSSRHQMWLYYLDHDADRRVLIKNYEVGLGRVDAASASKSLTPHGKYQLGQRTALFAPGVQGSYRGSQVEMVRVFGTRWVPFEKEVANCTSPAKGFGIHGAPWKMDAKTGKLVEDRQSVGGNESDGCIRLRIEDMEELYAIIATRATTIEIVPDFFAASLPGKE